MMKKFFAIAIVCLLPLQYLLAEAVESHSTKAANSTAVTTTEEPAKLAEDQIPLTIGEAKKTSEGGSTAAKAMMSLVIVAAMLGTGYYLVRRYRTSNTINKSNMQIKVLTQHYLGPKKSLAIIHVAGESILIGVTDSQISMIKSLSLIDDEVPANLPNNFGQVIEKTSAGGGSSAAEALAKTAETKTVTGSQMTAHALELDEEFSFANVTDNVAKKIKSMRSFS